MKPANLQNLAIGGAALALAGGALWLYFRGSRKAGEDLASGAVGLVGGVVSGAVNATGGAFQDVTQATFGLEKTDTDKCAAAIAAGDTWRASFACPAGTWLSSLFKPKPSGSVVYLNNTMTAPGGGIVPAADFSTYGTINDPRIDWSGAEVVKTNFNTSEMEFFKLFDSWSENWAPSAPVPLKVATNDSGSTQLYLTGGLRG